MGHGDRTGERLEMVAVRVDNYTPVEDAFDLWAARIEFLCSVYVPHYYLMLPHCHPDIVVSQTAHLVQPYWLS